ncbi:hypothetical protein B0H13DRAFT_1863670 [Mycena leptocephala]|nr:hypothetical protein B0H13DRAFT_1863670 [Mycena leptocephala]
MDTRRPKFRPILPKPPSQARPEPFLISTPSNQYASSHQETTGTSSAHALNAKTYGWLQSEFERRSLGQKKRRQRESKENQSNPKGSRQMNPHRSAAQRARRQRELAANIEGLLQTRGGENIRSRAQTLRRKVEEGERRLESNPDCDPTQALDRALDHEYDVNEPRRQDRYRESYRSQMLRYVAERHGAS